MIPNNSPPIRRLAVIPRPIPSTVYMSCNVYPASSSANVLSADVSHATSTLQTLRPPVSSLTMSCTSANSSLPIDGFFSGRRLIGQRTTLTVRCTVYRKRSTNYTGCSWKYLKFPTQNKNRDFSQMRGYFAPDFAGLFIAGFVISSQLEWRTALKAPSLPCTMGARCSFQKSESFVIQQWLVNVSVHSVVDMSFPIHWR